MRLTTVAVVALLVCASFAPAAMALGESSAERPGTSASADLGDRAGVTLQTGETNVSTATTTSQSNETDPSSGTNESDAALGLRVSSFVQSTSSETEGSVDSGMWAADVTRSNRPDAVDRRVIQLRERVSTLRTERTELRAAYEAGELTKLQYRSRLAELNGQLAALSTATEDTERAASQLNTRAPGLQRVREAVNAERRGGGFGLGRPTTDSTDAADGNESTADAPEPRRGEGNGNSGNGNDSPGNADNSRGNGNDINDSETVDSLRVDAGSVAAPLGL